MPHTIQPPNTSLNIVSPWISAGFISHPLEYMCLTKASTVLATSYSFWSSWHDVINKVNKYYIQIAQISSHYTMTEVRQVSRALRKN